jgi:hypothetical protein
MDDLKVKRGYCKLKNEALDRNSVENSFGKVYGGLRSDYADTILSSVLQICLTAVCEAMLLHYVHTLLT